MKKQNENFQLPVAKGCNSRNFTNKGEKYEPLFSTAQILQILFALFFFFYFLGYHLIKANL
jgi:hypothetical protein